MAVNNLKSPYFINRDNASRAIIGITDVVVGKEVTIGYTEHSADTNLYTLLADGDTRNYKVYTALLTQTGTSDPTAVVLENTLGTITWNYEGVGDYSFTLTGGFDDTSNVIVLATPTLSDTIISYVMGEVVGTLNTYDVSGAALTNARLTSTPVEIREYIVIDDVAGG